MQNVLLPAAYDADREAQLRAAILRLHAIIASAPDAEAKVLTARDAAGHLAALLLSMAKRAKETGDPRAAAAIPHALDALRALVAIRALYEAEGPIAYEVGA